MQILSYYANAPTLLWFVRARGREEKIFKREVTQQRLVPRVYL